MTEASLSANGFRVTISGKFTHLTSEQRGHLVAASDVALMSFSGAGTFTCDRTGIVRALALAALDAHGYETEVRRTAVVDLRDIKIPRRQRSRTRARQRA